MWKYEKKLQYPIYTSDLGDGYIRVFSSEEAYNYWIKSGKTLKDLVLLEFAKPSEFFWQANSLASSSDSVQ